jgi:hypothetical protein
VDLDQTVLVRRGPVDHEEDVVAVLVELGPLPELLGVLDRERMELEDVPQDLEVVRVGLVEVEPEETTLREELLDRLATEMRQRGVLADDHMARAVGRLSGDVAHGERIRPVGEKPSR